VNYKNIRVYYVTILKVLLHTDPNKVLSVNGVMWLVAVHVPSLFIGASQKVHFTFFLQELVDQSAGEYVLRKETHAFPSFSDKTNVREVLTSYQ
jgi:hypothetical protein